MGAADVVPGISGGTVALILGIYQRLVIAISHIDSDALLLISRGRLRDAARHTDFWFVASLGCGILTGIASLASAMRHLLIHHRSLTYAAFCGMILASVLIVARRVERWSPIRLGLMIGAATLALRIVTLTALQNPPDSLWYLFLCGTIGIIAMILPGISGAFLLVILQRYFYIIERLKELLHLNLSRDVLVPIIVFCAGCLTGLLIFSRFLKWLLLNYGHATISTLCGFMIGAMYCLWPFQRDTTPEQLDFSRKVFEPFMPTAVTSEVVAVVLIAIIAFVAIERLERLSQRMAQPVRHQSHGHPITRPVASEEHSG